MKIGLIILSILLWLYIGGKGFIYWWTTEFALEYKHLKLLFVVAITGPISWILGYFIHAYDSDNKVIIKKKSKSPRSG